MRYYRFLLLLILILLCVVYFSKEQFFKKADTETKTDLSKQQMPDSKTEQVQSFSIFGFSESGKKTWEVKGKSADILSEVINLSDIDGNSYGDEVTVNLKADEGVFNRSSNNLVLKKNIVVVTDEGTRLTTQSLNWNAKEELIDTDEYVLIAREDMDLEGIGAFCQPNLKMAQLNEDVKLKIKDSAAVVTCDGPLKVDYNKNVSYFYNNVKFDDGKAQIYSDESTAYFDPKRRELTRVFCEGNVKIVRGEDVSYTKELNYLPEEGKVILTGRPKIIIHSTEELLEESKEKKKAPVKNRKPTIITCDGPLEVYYNENVSYFYNNVKLDDGKTQIYSDKSTAYFDPKKRVVTKVFSEGNVKIVRGEDVTYSKELTYLPDEGKVVLSGRPKIVIHSTDELLEKSKEKDGTDKKSKK